MDDSFYIPRAHSFDNGIRIDSCRQEGMYVQTFVDEDGNIGTFYGVDFYREMSTKKKIAIILALVLGVCFVVGTLVYFPSPLLIWLWRMVFLSYALSILAQFFYLRCKSLKKNNGAIMRFHSAEHMAVNAYNDLHRVPTLEEIKLYPIYANECGINVIVEKFWIYTSLILASFLPDLFFVLVWFSSIIIVKILCKKGYFNFVQKYHTLPPTDRELKVAITGIEMWQKLEKGHVIVKIYE